MRMQPSDSDKVLPPGYPEASLQARPVGGSHLRGEYILRFVLVCLSVLVVAASLAYIKFPQKNPPMWEFLMNYHKQNKSFWERLLEHARPVATQLDKWRQAASSGHRVSSDATATPARPGLSGLTMSKEHLALRETALAQLVLYDRYKLPEEEVWATVKKTRSVGPFRDYEEKRFLSEIAWMTYQDDKANKEILQHLRRTATELVQKPSAIFEDYLNVGITHLLTGDADVAIGYLQEALERWPAPGRARGNVYLGLMIAHATQGHRQHVFRMLAGFKANYPDWLYVETYIPDLTQLTEVYPDAALLHVIHGRLREFVYDYASAQESYRHALNMADLDIVGKTTVRNWVGTIEDVALP